MGGGWMWETGTWGYKVYRLPLHLVHFKSDLLLKENLGGEAEGLRERAVRAILVLNSQEYGLEGGGCMIVVEQHK